MGIIAQSVRCKEREGKHEAEDGGGPRSFKGGREGRREGMLGLGVRG